MNYPEGSIVKVAFGDGTTYVVGKWEDGRVKYGDKWILLRGDMQDATVTLVSIPEGAGTLITAIATANKNQNRCLYVLRADGRWVPLSSGFDVVRRWDELKDVEFVER